jgi:hypothetical protein
VIPTRFIALVRSFPVLANHAPGVSADDLDLHLIDGWAAHDPADLKRVIAAGRSPFPGDGAKDAARFVLHVWDSRRAWRCGRFDLFAALCTWDDEQRRAFQAWAANPWRP